MPKSPRAALTRIATTVASQYYPSSGANAGFYLDGRISGRRERRTADITLDREDRGFFFSVFTSLASSDHGGMQPTKVRQALDRIMGEVKQPGRNIDAEINELAECAVHVAGRITLQHEGMSQPYFAGVVVRDSELAAVTMGSGCAYLYRGDVLYPLTEDDHPLEAIDAQGRPISGLDVYCAGVAGTVRYSNIAQLQLDDCILVCNKEVMEGLGQREMLRLLDEAEDQADAAGLIIDEASTKLPGVPVQVLIGFVESITTADRTGRINLMRGAADQTKAHTAPFSPTGRKKTDRLQAASPSVRDQKPQDEPAAGPPPPPLDDIDDDPDYEDDEAYADSLDSQSRGRRIAFYLIIAAICVGSLFAIYNMLFGGRDDPEQTLATSETTTTIETTEPVETTTTAATETEATEPDGTETETEPTPEGTTTVETTAETTAAETTTTTTAAATTAYAGETIAEHTVVEGDVIGAIAERYYGSNDERYQEAIVAANNLASADTIVLGQTLVIPAVDD